MKALALFIEPAFQSFNLDCSFAFIKGRGVKPAIQRIHDLVANGNKFYFEADIINFFGAVDRQCSGLCSPERSAIGVYCLCFRSVSI